jgi:predicted NAD/FAD-dependent oxidoreductase
VAALNTPAAQSSGQVFLRVIQDSLFGAPGGSNLLLPRVDLGSLFPDPAVRWLAQHGATVTLGQRVHTLQPEASQWRVDGQPFDRVLLACPPWEAARLVAASGVAANTWLQQAQALQFESIATIYATASTNAHSPTHQARLAQPMLSLRGGPAQFAFDRGQLGGPPGLLALVASASQGSKQALEDAAIAQGRAQLGLPDLQAVQTVVEKRATFACTPGLQRPSQHIAPGLAACGDYVDGPYPATLEGAVRSGTGALLNL